MEKMENLKEKVSLAIGKIIAKNAGLGYIVLKKQPQIIENEGNCQTAYTDGRGIFLAKSFTEQLTVDNTAAVILHEALHIQFLHFFRFDFASISKDKWDKMSDAEKLNKQMQRDKINAACDYAINAIIEYELGMTLPKKFIINGQDANILLDKQYLNMSAEEILKKLPENKKAGNNGGENESHEKSASEILKKAGENGGENGADANIKKELEKLEKDIMQDTNIANAITAGNIPGELLRLLDIYKNSGKLKWRQIVKNTIKSLDSKEFDNWQRMNKQYRNRGLYIPTKNSKTSKVLFAFDTSGSIDDDQLVDFFNEMIGLQKQIKNIEIEAISCDMAIKSHIKFKNRIDKKEIEKFFEGGGGTSHYPVFDFAKKSKIKQLFIFSDLQSDIEKIEKNRALYSGLSVVFFCKKRFFKKFGMGRTIILD